MFFSIPHPHYFSYKSNKEVKEIYWFTVINGVGLAMAYIFEPIYLYHLEFPLASIMWFYVEVYVLFCLLMSFGAKFAQKFGIKHSILISNFFYLIYWMTLFFIKSHSVLFLVAPLFFALQKSFFWPAFDTLTSLVSNQTERGRQIGVLFVLVELAYIVGPFFGGYISQNFGFFYLFIGAGLLMILSSYPLFLSREIPIIGEFEIKKLIVFVRNNPRNMIGYWGYAEDLMQMSLWPILMFTILHGYFDVGLIMTFASLVACMLMLYLGKLADYKDKSRLIKYISVFYGISWVVRFLAIDTISVIIFDVLTKIGKGLINIPIVSLTFETARLRNSGFTLMYTTFFEFSLALGKIFTGLCAISILNLTNNVYIVFALAGILTFFYSFLTKKIHFHESQTF
jgi:MFS family permease